MSKTIPRHPGTDATTAYMAMDQYGTTYHIGYTNSPRQWLLNHFDRKSAQRIFRDKLDGKVVHIGWIIAGHWLSVYEVKPMENPV